MERERNGVGLVMVREVSDYASHGNDKADGGNWEINFDTCEIFLMI